MALYRVRRALILILNLTWVQNNGVVKPIHLYLIEDGKVNIGPRVVDNFMEAIWLIYK